MENEVTSERIMTQEQLEFSLQVRREIVDKLSELLGLTVTQQSKAQRAIVYDWYKKMQPIVHEETMRKMREEHEERMAKIREIAAQRGIVL
jgi:hypothetical protein